MSNLTYKTKEGEFHIVEGTLATQCVGTDRYGYRVIEINEKSKTVTLVRHDESLENDRTITAKKCWHSNNWFEYRKNEKTGRWVKQKFCPMFFGFAKNYLDPHL